jgi:hypothetical protein
VVWEKTLRLDLTGTMLATSPAARWHVQRGATERSRFELTAIAVYEFNGTDLVCERIYINLRGLEDQMRG